MSQFERKCFFTAFLDDDDLTEMLAELCVAPQNAVHNDILAVEFPFSMSRGDMDSRTPSRVLVWFSPSQSLLLPWYTLVQDGAIDARRIELIARCMGRMSHHWCLSLSDQLGEMIRPKIRTKWDSTFC